MPETQEIIRVSADDVERLMREAVAERGQDYVYREHFVECLYVYPRIKSNLDEDEIEDVAWVDDEGHAKAACIVGEVLHRAGVPLRKLDVPDALVGQLVGLDLGIQPGSHQHGDVRQAVERALAPVIPDPSERRLTGVELDEVAFRMLSAAQFVQDSSLELTWGQALEAALDVRERAS